MFAALHNANFFAMSKAWFGGVVIDRLLFARRMTLQRFGRYAPRLAVLRDPARFLGRTGQLRPISTRRVTPSSISLLIFIHPTRTSDYGT